MHDPCMHACAPPPPRPRPPPRPPRRFKLLADKKKNIEDDDVLALLSDELHQPELVWDLVDLQVVCGTMGMPTATVNMKGPDGQQKIGVGVGTGEGRRHVCATTGFGRLGEEGWVDDICIPTLGYMH